MTPGFEFLVLDGVRIGIVPADEKIPSAAAGSIVYWNVKDFERTLEHLQALGATLYRGPMRIEDGQCMCHVRGPWGQLHWPAWTDKRAWPIIGQRKLTAPVPVLNVVCET